jgi:hypothetical protein
MAGFSWDAQRRYRIGEDQKVLGMPAADIFKGLWRAQENLRKLFQMEELLLVEGVLLLWCKIGCSQWRS